MVNVTKTTCRWLSMEKNMLKFNEDFIKNYDEESDEGFILEVDNEYPKILHDLHSDLPVLLERMKINKSNKIFDQKQGFIMLPHPLTNFEIQKYYQNEPRINGVYSRDNLPDKIKDWAYVLNLDEYSDIETHWIDLYALNNNVTYFDRFGVERIPKEIKKFIDKSTIIINIFRIQAHNSVMCGYFCIGFINFMLDSKSLTTFTNLFSPNNFKKMMI